MVVRLQTADGEIKGYETAQVKWVSCGDSYYIDKYITTCGREWKPGAQNQECDHMECAIHLVAERLRANEQTRRFLAAIAVISFVITIIAHLKGISELESFSFLYLIFFIPCAFFSLNWRSKQIIGHVLAAIAVVSFISTAIGEIKVKIGLIKYTFMISIISTFLAILFLGFLPGDEEHFDELTEFKNSGTIKGISACQITDDTHTR